MTSKKIFCALILLLFTASLWASPLTVQAALPAYMTLEGETQGDIEGSCQIQGREGTIVVYGFGHNVRIPIDPQSSTLTGKRIHSPMEVLKEFDKSSPKLYQALCTNERLQNVTIKFYRANSKAQEVHYFTIQLENAVIVKIAPSFPTTFLPENQAYRHTEIISFSYQKIKWTYEDGGIEAQDDWETPHAKQ